MKKSTLLIAVLAMTKTMAQIGINTPTPQATFDIIAKTTDGSKPEGMITPRLTGDQIKSSDSVFGIAQRGTLIYATAAVNTPSAKTVNITAEGHYYFDGNIWQKFGNSISPIAITGDIKNSARTADHNGWYLLNGRAISTLPANAQVVTTALGFVNNIPNATDRVLKMLNTTETIGVTGGNNTITIAQTNLPNVSLSGTVSATAASAGTHAHGSAAGVFIVGGSMINNNGTGNYYGHGDPNSAWGGIGAVGTTANAGAHTHSVSGTATVPTGGTGASLDNRSAYLAVNIFIYLGQ